MKQSVYKGYVINATEELSVDYRIAPFSNKFHSKVEKCESELDPFDLYCYLDERFGNYCFTVNGRAAIEKALSFFALQRDDVVTIFTTSGNLYVSGCVTKGIEKYCSWSRELTPQTKVIFVVHEFGYPYKNLLELKKYGLPIIEDCAHTFFSQDENNTIGKVGDFVIYSLGKPFPMQMGGILVSNKVKLNSEDISEDVLSYIEIMLRTNLHRINDIIDRRISNYNQMSLKLARLGIEPFFKLDSNVVPGVFLFKWNRIVNFVNLKMFMQRNGVESSVFYGQNAFFIPVHEFITDEIIDYFSVLLEFYNETNQE